jgi:hypothetical protein
MEPSFSPGDLLRAEEIRERRERGESEQNDLMSKMERSSGRKNIQNLHLFEGDNRTRNVHLGSAGKMDAQAARQSI